MLLFDPPRQALRPLVEKLLLKPDKALSGWWENDLMSDMTVADILTAKSDAFQEEKGSGARQSSARSSHKNSKSAA